MKIILFLVTWICSCSSGQYTADWESLDSRPLPQWYDDAKIGIFIHWGIYSVPAFGTEWFWWNWRGRSHPNFVQFMEQNYRPGFSYQDFAPQFTADMYDPDEWVKLFEAAGAKYVVLTSKHHDGYTLWPSNYSFGWNSMDVGPKRDLVGDLTKSLRSETPNIRLGLYYSLYEWFNPLFLMDKKNKFKTSVFVSNKVQPELYEITNLYKPEIVWSDGEWEASHKYWNTTEYLAWLFNDSPVKDSVVVNDRWGSGPVICQHGSFHTCKDRYNPRVLQDHKWENAMTLDMHSWGYNRRSRSEDYFTVRELLMVLIETVSCGGNILVNAGPTPDGRIPPIMEERLRDMGKWLALNGEAIYESRPWIYQNDSYTEGVWYTRREKYVYATVLFWPKNNLLPLESVNPNVLEGKEFSALKINLLGYPHNLEATLDDWGLNVTLPSLSEVDSEWAWVLKIEGLAVTNKTLD